MKLLSFVLFFISFQSFAADKLKLSGDIFRKVPFSDLYSKDGALIRNVDFKSVNNLIPQIEKSFDSILKGRKLQDRNEAHITVITPPEGRTDFIPGKLGIDSEFPTELMLKNYKDLIQFTTFTPVCIGMQSNNAGNIVFYLVVESKDILNIRSEISDYVLARNGNHPFKNVNDIYYPHITIGYIGGDVHNVDKGVSTCIAELTVNH